VGLLIDASILIGYERRDLDPAKNVAGREDDRFFLSVITVGELLHGVHRAQDPGHRARRSAFVESIIDRFPLLPIDLPTARIHAEIWATLAASGRLIGSHDLWLAAAALAHGLSLATANVREFERVPGLDVEHWRGGL
jgi:tRNA(fMet)-specific endonuclease VapC